MDARGVHVAICKCGGLKILRHSRLVGCVRGVLRESGATVSPVEVRVPGWTNSRGEEARLEVAYVVDGFRRYADVTIRHPRAVRHVGSAADRDGAAAGEGEAAKLARYPAVADAGLEAVVPFAVETFGRLGPQALGLLRDARSRLAERSRAARGWLGAALHARLTIGPRTLVVAQALLGFRRLVYGDHWLGQPH